MKRKLNLGCGKSILDGWINLDIVPLEGVDVTADLDDCANTPLPFEDDSIDEFYASHLIEHIRFTLPFMQELHRIAKKDARATFILPYGSSDDAFEDPTHVRPYFLQSFGYFSQPYYWWADYGYRGDWLAEKITLLVDATRYQHKNRDEILFEIDRYRNVVNEMVVELRALKPIRPAQKDLQEYPEIDIQFI